jgi:5'-methylthioadenosine phosphorylase
MLEPIRIGVIGGSGVYSMDALSGVEEIVLDTPFGAPSDAYIVGMLHGQRVAFLPRHGRGHVISPTRLNQRANIYGFKQLGVEYLISVSACGSLQEQYAPGHIVIPDQLFDRTTGRTLSFFDDPDAGTGSIVAHISFAHPFCDYLSDVCYRAVEATGNPAHKGGAFVTVEGPRFSTRAESELFRTWGFDLVGMTTTPEAQLAREAEMSYAVMAHVTDYDCWHETAGAVTVEMVVQTLLRNADVARQAVANAVQLLADAPPAPQGNALRDALITDPARVPPQAVKALEAILGKYFPGVA